jgi:predicted nucleic acid-binding protein
MNRIVIDASVAIKWSIPEIHSAEALRYLDPSLERQAPELLLAEIANILLKKTNRGEITPDQSLRIADDVRQSDVTIYPMSDLIVSALSIALATGRSAYDSMYLALADALGTQVVTADRKLYNAIQNSPYAQLIRWVEEEP